MMKLRFEQGDNGFVSLFTCIMFSLLLLVITIGLVSLESLQLRKSEDAEQTLRAYYAAEAGVEDAVSKVLAGEAVGAARVDQPCVANTSFDIPGAAGWTCQQITYSGQPTGQLGKPDEAKTVDPGGVPGGYQSVLVEWDQSTNPSAAFFNAPTTLPAAGGWNYAAPIELAIVQYPNAGFAAGNGSVTLKNALILPSASGGAVNYASLLGGGQQKGNCRPQRTTGFNGQPTVYNCYAIINGFSTTLDYMFRIRSRYAASAYRFTFYTGANGTGTTVKVPDGTATIDVTASAGQTYRRVISKLPLGDSAAAGLNFVMYSDTDICKDFELIDNVNQNDGCPY